MLQSTLREQAETRTTAEPGSPALFPMFLKLAGRACLVVGAGAVGTPKIEGLLAAGADVTVVAPQATEAVQGWAEVGRLLWHARCFEPSDLDGVFLVVAATSSNALNDAVFKEAQRRGVLANVVDDPPRCDFYYPAVFRRGDLQIAVSTDGKSPALAQRLRKQFEREFGPVYQDWVEELGRERQRLFAQPMDAEKRRQMLHALASESSFEAYVGRRTLAGKPERTGGDGQ
ncbi:MAG TPA: bifunctional precorrin-2 dehydrogenase/sirohydrochlorin ferrochelatase [Terriglobia bacterium]|nr:bifunctional precorrin-2 dehydrogenase/sirohydrochlorin ferrochelatase [Terriglobia bacterium]